MKCFTIFTLFIAYNVAEKLTRMDNEFESVLQNVKNGILNFTLKFEQTISQLTTQDQNIIFAPVSIVNILATLLLGAESDTRTEILNVMGLPIEKNLTNRDEKIHKAFGELLELLLLEQKNNPAVKVDISRGIFIQNNTRIQNEFKNLSEVIYKNEINEVDFTAASEAVDTINQWVSNRTKGRIRDIIQPTISSNTKLILLNTLYFDGEWNHPFYCNLTWKNFYVGNEIVKVKMMVNQGSVYVYKDEIRNFITLGLPYKGNNTYMYIILPDRDENLRTVLSKITIKDLIEIPLNSTKEIEKTYWLPKLNIAKGVNLKVALQNLGVRNAFDASKANLSKIADDVFIGDAVHKVDFDITEAGSTGSAATSIMFETRISDSIIVNRPFSFFIYHRTSEMIIFWGTINVPVPNIKNSGIS